MTTAATGNVTANVGVNSGSTLTLGADLTLTGTLDVRHNGSKLDMGGHTITANQIFLGWNDGYPQQPITVQNRGTLLTNNLYVGNQTFNLIATDSVSNFFLINSSTVFGATNTVNYLSLNDGSTVTTAATGNVTGSASVLSGSTLTLGANMSLAGDLRVENSGSKLDMGGHTISANRILLGWDYGQPTSVQNRGTILTNHLYVGNQTFNLIAADAMPYLDLGNAMLTTAATGNVTGSASVLSGSTLTLGANMSLAGDLRVENSGSKLDMGGHTISANRIFLGWDYGQPISVQNRGTIITNHLYVGNQTFNLIAADAMPYLDLGNAMLTTAATGNVTGSASVLSGSTLTLGANMSLAGDLRVENSGSKLDMGGHTISANRILLGWDYGQPTSVQNRGTILTNHLYVGNQTFNLIATDSMPNLYLGNVILTTAATGNVTANAIVYSGSTLTLGANMSLTGDLRIENSGSKVDMGGHMISANRILLGWDYGQPTTLLNGGAMIATKPLHWKWQCGDIASRLDK